MRARPVVIAAASLVAWLVLAGGQALASGGATIATAPSVTYGQQLFGNTAIDDGGETLSECVDGESWWNLPVLAGDQVRIDYEGGLDYLQVWGVGTTDFNIHTAPSPSSFTSAATTRTRLSSKRRSRATCR